VGFLGIPTLSLRGPSVAFEVEGKRRWVPACAAHLVKEVNDDGKPTNWGLDPPARIEGDGVQQFQQMRNLPGMERVQINQ